MGFDFCQRRYNSSNSIFFKGSKLDEEKVKSTTERDYGFLEPAIWGLYTRQEVNKMGQDSFIQAQSLTQKYKGELAQLVKTAVKAGVVEAIGVLFGEEGEKNG